MNNSELLEMRECFNTAIALEGKVNKEIVRKFKQETEAFQRLVKQYFLNQASNKSQGSPNSEIPSSVR